MSTSQENQNFILEPMGDKPVTDLAGIDRMLGRKLAEKGFDKAYTVLGQFLLLKKQEELFEDWLHQNFGANSKQSGECYSCLKKWCEEFL